MMNITLNTITVRELVEGFENHEEEGVFGYGGKLDIRPPFQRKFIYEEKEKKAVINSIFSNYPLNVMYWVKNAEDNYELLDGQQRTMSICSYWNGAFFVHVGGKPKYFDNLTPEQAEQFLNYELQVYVCENGTDQEIIDWFRVINIEGKKLTNQELLNAVYTGPWVTNAKLRFSKTGCVAYKLGKDYMSGNMDRQDYLETVLRWISGGNIEKYMAKHQHDPNADREWQYFQTVINWIQTIFPKYRNQMKGLDWGGLYSLYGNREYSATELENRIAELMIDEDVSNRKGIYDYVLSGDERKLNLRGFSEKIKIEAYERQKGVCPVCGLQYKIGEMEGDHITPWSEGGRTVAENCQMLCKDCNRRKSNK